MKAFVKSLIVLSLGLGGVGMAKAQTVDCATQCPTVPTMIIKIFNDDPHHTIFPTFTTGHHPALPDGDIWLKSIFKVPKNDEATHPYPTNLTYRFFINPTTGIRPGQGVTLTIPLYTPKVSNPSPVTPDQYIDWWNGDNMWTYYSDYDKTDPPLALTYDLNHRSSQTPVNTSLFPPNVVLPTCETATRGPCDPLVIYQDTGGEVGNANPNQLLEFTLGARNELIVVNPATDPSNTIDLKNVDFDISFVDGVFGPAAMGTYQNDQVGYVGSPKPLGQSTDQPANGKCATIQCGMQQFKINSEFLGWPQFVKQYNQTLCPTCPASETFLKFPSLLNVFGRLSGVNPPADLTPPPDPMNWPNSLWPPIKKLFDNWTGFAGHVGKTDGKCKSEYTQDSFCSALLRVKKLIADNFKNYQTLSCHDPNVKLTDQVMIAKVYAWQSFQENCAANANTLPNTPGYWIWANSEHTIKDYAKYNGVKLDFDKLNYQQFTDTPIYNFNPWVQLIHNDPYLGIKNAYAYSVDDAVGNIQAYGGGIVINFGGTTHLENPNEAGDLVTITLGAPLPTALIQWTSYRLCQNDPTRERRLNPRFTTFDVDSANMQNCPIFAFDNKVPPQEYTFRIKVPKNKFAEILIPTQQMWTQTTGPATIDCSGNAAFNGPPSNSPSSALWCCEKLAGPSGTGVFGFRFPVTDVANKQELYKVITNVPYPTKTIPMGKTVCP